jgi:hypothetical protein
MSDYETLIQQSRHNAAIEAEEMNLVALLRPRVFIDGNKWCVLYGENLQDGVAGFGDSPILAVYDFNKAWRKGSQEIAMDKTIPEAVAQLRRLADVIRKHGTIPSLSLEHIADSLTAAQQQGQAVAWMTPESIAHLAKQNGPAKVDAWNCASGTERVPLYTASPSAPVGVKRNPCAETACAMWTNPSKTAAEDAAFMEGFRVALAQQPATVDEAAAQASEIEALRADVERLEEIVGGPVQTYDMLKARAERLAEALRLAEEHINALTPEWYSAGQRVLAAIRAALEQEGEG